MTRRVFLTGASGFIGAATIEALAHAGVEMTLLSRKRTQVRANPGSTIVTGDLLDPKSYEHALAGASAVIHLAALTGKAAPSAFHRTNVQGVENLIEACKRAGVHRFLFVSSIAASYQHIRHYPYASSKVEAERIVARSGLDYTIVRPTIVLGTGSPIWRTLSMIATAPIIPLPEGRSPVNVQPIDVADVARGLATLVTEDRFRGETLELGGPVALPMRTFLSAIRKQAKGRDAVFVRVPLDLAQFVLAAVEPFARPLLPATAGQLSVFGNDSTAQANWLSERLAPEMADLQTLIAASSSRKLSEGERSSRQSFADQNLRSSDRLARECATFSSYLADADPGPQVTDHYVRALTARGMIEERLRFDRYCLSVARLGGLATRSADAYCALFARRGLLRRRLLLLLALLESAPGVHSHFERSLDRGRMRALLSLAAAGVAAASSFLLGALLLGPAQLMLRGAARPS